MNIGYACQAMGIQGLKLRSCTVKNASPEVLRGLILANLNILDRMLDYNQEKEIKLFRISSDIIPFGSHPINTLKWWEDFQPQLKALGEKAMAGGMRLSMHPGQYTVLNSPNEGVVSRAFADLEYHCRFLDAMGLGREHKIILHIGGTYGDKGAAIERFIQQYRNLDKNIQHRLVIENDDRQYTIGDVLSIGKSEAIPVVFDSLHHQVHIDDGRSEVEWIAACAETWKAEDGAQKLHYSQQAAGKRSGAHSETIDVSEFLEFCKRLPTRKLDIMMEVKDKNLSAIKCINATSAPKISRLEQEWGLYKYLVLERSPGIYNEIRQLLKDKAAYPVVVFYKLIDEALKTQPTGGNAVNAAQHVWGYVRNFADEKTRFNFEKQLEKVSQGCSTTTLKRQLWKMASAHGQTYLLNSYYFTL